MLFRVFLISFAFALGWVTFDGVEELKVVRGFVGLLWWFTMVFNSLD